MDITGHLHDSWGEKGWDAAAPGLAGVTELDRAYRTLVNRADEILQQFNLSFERYEVLQLLCFSRGGQISVTRLRLLLQVHSTSVTSAVDRLVDAGLVQRHRDSGDARMAVVVITGRGQTIASRATARLNSDLLTDLGLAGEQPDVLWSVVRSVRSNAGDFVPASAQVKRSHTMVLPGSERV
jgi:DNA-binding MarR family transcriptional regulator